MKINLESSEPDIRVELIPLIDVIFCILTFFILAAVTLTRQTAINIDLPKAASGTPQMREMSVVTIDQYGQVYFEQDLVSQADLYQKLLDYHQTNPQGLLVLRASPFASYSQVIQVLDMLKLVGGDRVALATESSGATEINPLVPGLTTPGLDSPSDPYLVDPANPFPAPNIPGGTDPY
jgi:biopolymer transport protein ExbD